MNMRKKTFFNIVNTKDGKASVTGAMTRIEDLAISKLINSNIINNLSKSEIKPKGEVKEGTLQ